MRMFSLCLYIVASHVQDVNTTKQKRFCLASHPITRIVTKPNKTKCMHLTAKTIVSFGDKERMIRAQNTGKTDPIGDP